MYKYDATFEELLFLVFAGLSVGYWVYKKIIDKKISKEWVILLVIALFTLGSIVVCFALWVIGLM